MIVESLALPISISGIQVPVSVSMGICACIDAALESDAVLKKAGTALCAAREHGCDRFERFTPEAPASSPSEMTSPKDAVFLGERSGDLRLQLFLPSYARPANSRVSVFTLTASPILMKNGTLISRPVSSFAALVTPPLDVSPRTAGSVYSTFSST